MKTNLQILNEQDFPNSLVLKLNTALEQNIIHSIWFGKSYGFEEIDVLWLYVANKESATKVFSAESCNRYAQRNKIIIILLDKEDLEYHKNEGSPFVKLSLYKASLIFNDEDLELPSNHIYSSSIRKFKERYLGKQALLALQCTTFIEEDLEGGSYVYLKSFEYDVGVLETLLLGVKKEENNLTERVLLLETVFPPIRSLFVKNREGNFYIIDRIEKDIEGALYNDWGEALEAIQEKLKNHVVELLNKMERETSYYGKPEKVEDEKTTQFEAIMNLKPLIDSNKVEEIYKFHEAISFQNKNVIRHFYLLALIKEGTEKEVQNIISEINKNQEDIHFVIISHTRFYLQRHLYTHKAFFKDLLDTKEIIYSSGYYPTIHWEKTYSSEYDYQENLHYLDHPLSSIDKLIKSRIHEPEASPFISSKDLYKCIYIKLQVYILSQIHYLPKTTNLDTLYYLALYAGNEDQEFTNLFKELSSFLFDFVIKNKEVEVNNIMLDEDKQRSLQNFFKLLEV